MTVEKDLSLILNKALLSLAEALDEKVTDNPLAIDATIRRFKLSFELFWKVLKEKLAEQGVTAKSPKQALQEAYQLEWIHDEALWLKMLEDRDQTSHTYNDDLAAKIYSHVAQYYEKMSQVYKLIS